MAARQCLGQREQGRVVGHIARSEQQSCLLLVQRGHGRFQVLVEQRVARDVAGASGACAVGIQGLADSLLDLRVPRHTKVVVGAPHGDGLLAPSVLHGGREFGRHAVHLLEHTVRVILLFLLDLLVEESLVRELFS